MSETVETVETHAAEPAPAAPSLASLDTLRTVAARILERRARDPFANPVMAIAMRLSRQLDDGTISFADIAGLIRTLRDEALIARAGRLRRYVGLDNPVPVETRFEELAARLIRPDPQDSPVPFAQFRRAVERARFSAVFTAHPTFAVKPEVYAAIAAIADTPGTALPPIDSHRPSPPTLDDEFIWATAAMSRGRDAIDRLNRAMIAAAADCWPQSWRSVLPCPITLSSWVGYDTDGRTDIGWSDTIRLRLRMKSLQLSRLRTQLDTLDDTATAALRTRLDTALDTVAAQIAACPSNPTPEQSADFARALIGGASDAIRNPDDLAADFNAAMDALPPAGQISLATFRAGLVGHGMGLAHTQVRLNATQLHNVVRQRLGLTDSPEHPARRRALLAAINEHLDTTVAVPVDIGAILVEQTSAARLMMTVAQIAKHIDTASPVRFLIAETEGGYTLLAALWLATLFGIADRIEISPLFETADALERGAQVIEEALRSPHWRAYLRRTGKMALQFGYSDSGRYVGQLAATYLIERLRLKVVDLLVRHKLTEVEVILFDTHGESIGRGAHPFSLADRLDYISPIRSWQYFLSNGLALREESAIQGGDGYLLMGTERLAEATIATIAAHAFSQTLDPKGPDTDPVYDEPDFSADFFTAVATEMQALVEDPGYAAVLGAFGPSLIDRTGSRPPARQSDGGSVSARIRHPRELRAIPNNALLQQLGWCANTLQGLGAAAARHPETFDALRDDSPRFRRALDFAEHALAHSSTDVLRAIVVSLDPGVWLDRADHATDPAHRQALVGVARALERFDLWAITQSMFRRIQSDHLALRVAWPDMPQMALDTLLLHAIRIALIDHLWTLSTRIPYFSPRHGVTREALDDMILRLEIPTAQRVLAEAFPASAEISQTLDFGEPGPQMQEASYSREHAEIFRPIQTCFDLIREISIAVAHDIGAFG